MEHFNIRNFFHILFGFIITSILKASFIIILFFKITATTIHVIITCMNCIFAINNVVLTKIESIFNMMDTMSMWINKLILWFNEQA